MIPSPSQANAITDTGVQSSCITWSRIRGMKATRSYKINLDIETIRDHILQVHECQHAY